MCCTEDPFNLRKRTKFCLTYSILSEGTTASAVYGFNMSEFLNCFLCLIVLEMEVRVTESGNLSWARIHEVDFIMITERKFIKMHLPR